MKCFNAAVLTGVLVALMPPRVACALSAQAVGQTAKQITVLIESDDQNSQGSGIIIKHSGSTYYVITALHVVEQKAHYSITTVDGKHYALDQAQVKKLATGVDLAIVQFNSSAAYQVAKIGNSDQATEGAAVYVAGFAVKTAIVPTSIYRFVSGQMTANAHQALPGGYALI